MVARSLYCLPFFSFAAEYSGSVWTPPSASASVVPPPSTTPPGTPVPAATPSAQHATRTEYVVILGSPLLIRHISFAVSLRARPSTSTVVPGQWEDNYTLPAKCDSVATLVKIWHDTADPRPSVAELENSFKSCWRTGKNSRNKHPYQRGLKLMAEIDRRAQLQVGDDAPLTFRARLSTAEAHMRWPNSLAWTSRHG